MKNYFLILALMFSMSTSYADNPGNGKPVPLTVKTTTPESELNPLPKSPIQIPEVYLDGNTLSFDAAIEGCEVRLLDENEDVVFSDFIEENQTSLLLPTTLTGTFELQIVRGNIIFYCEIEL